MANLQEKKQKVLQDSPVKLSLSEQDIKWFNEIEQRYCSYSPLSPVCLMGTDCFETLVNELSKQVLQNIAPKAHQTADDSIISIQTDFEDVDWINFFEHFKTLTPNFMFNSHSKEKEYLDKQCEEFWNFLYVPLQRQYNSYLKDIISYNYSPFNIDLNLFKK